MTTLTSKYGTNKTGVFDWEVINSNTNAIKDRGYLIDASSNTVTLTLMSSPAQGDAIGIKDYNESAGTNTITIARNGNNIVGVAEDLTFDITGFGLYMVYSDATEGWVIVSGTAGVTNSISDVTYGTTWSGVSDIAPSKNAVYDEMEFRTKAAAVVADNKLIRGDGGSRGVQEANIEVDDDGIVTMAGQSGCGVKLTSDQTITQNTSTKLALATEVWDTRNEFDNVTNYRFTAGVAGKFVVTATCEITSLANGYRLDGQLKKNGVYAGASIVTIVGNTGSPRSSLSAVLDFAVNDYIELFIFHNYTSSRVANTADHYNVMQIQKIG